MLKKVLIGFIGFIFLILIAIVIIPFVVNVDQYRPELVKVVNENINGKFELKKLSLSLWGKVHVAVDGLKLSDVQGNSIVEVKDASFDMPFTSAFSGSPALTFQMTQPELKVLKNKEGKINVLSLTKSKPEQESSSAGASSSTEPQKSDSKTVALPAMALRARLGIQITQARLIYSDAQMNLTNTIDDLNVKVKDLSLSRPTEIEVWANLKTQMGKDLKVEGPLKLVATLKSEVISNAEGGGEVKGMHLKANFNADSLDIQQGSLFHKSKNIPAHFSFEGSLGENDLRLKDATAVFHNAEITVKGFVHKSGDMSIDFNAKPIELKPWSELVPMLKEYELEGLVSLDGNVQGPLQSMKYSADLDAKNISVKGPYLKAKPIMQASIAVRTNKVEKLVFNLKGPGNDVTVTGSVQNFLAPQVQFLVKSSGMDLDQWIDFPKPEPKKGASATNANKAAQPEVDFDNSVEPLRQNAIAKATAVDGTVSIAFFKAMNVRMDQIEAKLQFKNLIAALSGLKFKMFNGEIAGSFSADLKPKQPLYNMKLSVKNLDMAKAVESQFESFKNTIVGKLDTSFEGGGASFNPLLAKKNLKAKGSFKIINPTFKSIDVAKVANEGIRNSIQKIGEKVPALKGRSVNVPANRETKYEFVSGSFTLQQGYLEAPDFLAKPAPQSGIEIKGFTKMGLIDESLDARWEMIDTYGLTGAKNLDVEIAGKHIKNILAKNENEPVILPIKVGCKWSAPCASYTEVPEYLAGVAASRIAKGAGEAAKAKAAAVVQDAVKKVVEDKVPPQVKDQVKGGLKKLFGR